MIPPAACVLVMAILAGAVDWNRVNPGARSAQVLL